MTYFLIYNGTLIDGAGKQPVDGAAVLIKDDKIEYAGPEDSLKLPDTEIR